MERACKLNVMFQSDSLHKVAGDVSVLPSAPGMYLAITRAIANPIASISDLAHIIEKDPGLCAKILQVANSAFFGIGRKVTNITEASTYLGMTTLNPSTRGVVKRVAPASQAGGSAGVTVGAATRGRVGGSRTTRSG